MQIWIFEGEKALAGKNKVKKIRDWMIRYYLILIIGLLIVILMTNVWITARTLWDNTLLYSMQLISETQTSVDIALEKIQMLASITNNNDEIRRWFAGMETSVDQSDDALNPVNESQLLTALNSISFIERNVLAVTLLSSDGKEWYSSNPSSRNEFIDFLKSQQPELGKTYNSSQWTALHGFSSDYPFSRYKVVSFQRHFIDNSSVKDMGSVFFTVSTGYFTSMLRNSKIGRSSSIYLLDNQNRIIADGSSAHTGEAFFDEFTQTINSAEKGYRLVRWNGAYCLLNYMKLDNAPWKMVALVPMNDSLDGIISNLGAMIAVGILGITLCIILSVYMSHRITRPINKLLQGMQKVEQCDGSVDFSDDTFHETKVLGQGINHMLTTIARISEQPYEGQLRQKKVEFENLRAQINPHFVCNTLETVNLMLLVDGREDLSEIITDLSDVLRYSIRSADDLILLGDDFENMRKYLRIQNVRYGDRHTCHVEITPEAAQCKVLKLIVQPFVENALQHGMENEQAHCTLELSAWVEDGWLFIRIEDDGAGMSMETVRSALDFDAPDDHGRHLGMRNTFKRIRLYYGDKSGIDVKSGLGTGTIITLSLPVLKGEIADENFDCR